MIYVGIFRDQTVTETTRFQSKPKPMRPVSQTPHFDPSPSNPSLSLFVVRRSSYYGYGTSVSVADFTISHVRLDGISERCRKKRCRKKRYDIRVNHNEIIRNYLHVRLTSTSKSIQPSDGR